jgi:TfoX/Sxy family transcriptional regulator of competence genes
MAYDEELAGRVDEILVARKGIDRRKMFGGVGYLLHGSMCVGVWKSYLILRLGDEGASKALARNGTRPFDITGRPMKGWVMVESGALSGEQLEAWVDKSFEFVLTLPLQRSG